MLFNIFNFQFFLFFSIDLTKSVAQQQVEDRIKPALEDNQEFLKLFSLGITDSNNQMFNEYRPAESSNTGIKMLKQMTSKK